MRKGITCPRKILFTHNSQGLLVLCPVNKTHFFFSLSKKNKKGFFRSKRILRVFLTRFSPVFKEIPGNYGEKTRGDGQGEEHLVIDAKKRKNAEKIKLIFWVSQRKQMERQNWLGFLFEKDKNYANLHILQKNVEKKEKFQP